jgi:ribosomal protein RSM22 (predicted rRNA methylase)
VQRDIFNKKFTYSTSEILRKPTSIIYSQVRYDLVTCSFTLLDLASERERLVVVDNLWKKTEHFLILIEVGSNAGFQVR